LEIMEIPCEEIIAVTQAESTLCHVCDTEYDRNEINRCSQCEKVIHGKCMNQDDSLCLKCVHENNATRIR